MTTSRSVRLHARIAEGLEEMYGNVAEPHAGDLVYHFAEAEPVVGTGKLMKYIMLAGERALEAYAQEEALGHFRPWPLPGSYAGPATIRCRVR